MEKILLFIPGYNCENQIIRVLKKIDSEVLQYVSEIIFINNRSTDKTEEKVLQFKMKHPKMNLKILRNDINYGLGGSHKVAFDYALKNAFDYIIVLHGDDQGNIHDIIPILKSGKYREYDCMLGARFMKGSKSDGYSTFRTFGNRIYNILFSIILRKKIYDLGSGLNMYGVDMLKNKFYHKFADNLTFNCYMLLASKYYKHKICFFPISWREEDQISNVKMVNQAINTLKLLMNYHLNPGKYIKSELRKNPYDQYTAQIINKAGEFNE
jgi:glycosyltransferase involved in cell wall biosynthesis